MSNVAAFNALAAWMLATLYDAQPMQINLTLEDTPADVQEPIAATSERPDRFFWQTAEWLEREGFITAKATLNSRPALLSASLTLKGFLALNAVPDSIGGRESIGNRLSEAVKDAAREGRAALIAELVGLAVALFARQ